MLAVVRQCAEKAHVGGEEVPLAVSCHEVIVAGGHAIEKFDAIEWRGVFLACFLPSFFCLRGWVGGVQGGAWGCGELGGVGAGCTSWFVLSSSQHNRKVGRPSWRCLRG